jgi:hypothetical protein
MRIMSAIVASAVACSPLLGQDAHVPLLAREVVEEALSRSKDGPRSVEVRPSRLMNLTGTGFVVQLEGPANRVEAWGRQRLKKYLPILADSVPSSLLHSTLSVVASPLTQVTSSSMKGEMITPPATHAVLVVMTEGTERIVQPMSTETFEVEVRGMAEANKPPRLFKSQGVRAAFSYGSLPATSFKVRIVTEGKEYEYVIDDKRRALLRD